MKDFLENLVDTAQLILYIFVCFISGGILGLIGIKIMNLVYSLLF